MYQPGYFLEHSRILSDPVPQSYRCSAGCLCCQWQPWIKKNTLYISASQKCKKDYNIRPAFMLLIMFKRSDLLIISIIIYMKKCRNSDWLRAVRLIPKQWNFVLSVQIYVITVQIYVIKFWREKILHGKNKYGGQHLANSGNISLRFEVNSTVTLPVKCPLTKLEES